MKKGILKTVVTIVVLLGVLGGGWYFLQQNNVVAGGVIKDSGRSISDYSAVFLTNGQVYFGKIEGMNNLEVDLRDIYYLQVNQQQTLQPGDANADNQPEISLVKLGNELHGPNDRMRISRSQVLFTESLKKDSKVVAAIEDYQSK
jgi:hypothetical protein